MLCCKLFPFMENFLFIIISICGLTCEHRFYWCNL
jgi:hypothetical protein